MLSTIATAIAGKVAGNMLGGGGGGGGTTVIREPRALSLTKYKRPTGRRGSGARRTTAAKVSSPAVYGGGFSRYNTILKKMLRDTSGIKAAKAPRA